MEQVNKGLEKPKPSQKGEPPKVPIVENLPEPLLKSPNSDIVRDKSIITTERPRNRDNSLLPARTEKNPLLLIINPNH